MDKTYLYEEIVTDLKLKEKIFSSILDIIDDLITENIIAVKWSPVFNKIGPFTLVLTTDIFYYIAKLKGEKKLTSHEYKLENIENIEIKKFGKGAIVEFDYDSIRTKIMLSEYEETLIFFDILRQVKEQLIDFNIENTQEHNTVSYDEENDIDYENMDIEDLQKQLEKEKLIAELKQLKAQNSNQSLEKKSSVEVTHNYIPPQPTVSRPLSKKQQIKENKKNGIACCPKCGSTSISATNKKLSIGRAIVGTAILPGVGTVLGGVSSKKTVCVCMNCGHKWKP